jgi:hypothetical protein
VSSILDALEKLEARRTAGDAPEPPRRARRRIVPLLAGAAVVAFATGIAITAVLMRPADEPVVTAARAVAPEQPPIADAAPTPATNPPAPPAPARAVEQPWGEVVSPPAPRTFSADPLPARDAGEPPAPPRERRAPAALAAAPPPTTPPPAAARPAGAPGVQVSFLVYSSVPARRTVALKVDGGGLVTLHEGESTGGFSVVEILPDGVDLDWQGQVYTVHARD